MNLPEGFKEMMEGLLGVESEAFFKSLEEPPAVAVRLNSRKPTDAFTDAEPVPWCPRGRYLPERPLFTLDPLLHAGAYYVQDASSQILWHVAKIISKTLQEETGSPVPLPLSAADLCAAPGGKSTAIIDALPDGSRLVANEFVAKRAGILRENITKWGVPGVSVTNLPVSAFAKRGDEFDFVNVDAPCSGEGMMRKDTDAVAQWSPQLIEKCAKLQREILADAAQLVKPGGFLVYSTCTYNTLENEANAAYIRDELGLIPWNPHFPEEWGIRGGIGTEMPVFRFMPHVTRGEGLFLTLFRKPGTWEPSRMSAKKIPKAKKTPGDIPEMEEILSTDFDRHKWPLAELTLPQAQAYLRREAIVLGPEIPKGYAIVTYRGIPLGPVKNIGSRANNLYPKAWRILMRP